jgi:hypothetical protein
LNIDLEVNWHVSVSKGGYIKRLKDIHGTTYEEMLISYDKKVLETIGNLLSYPYSDLMDNDFCMELRGPGALQARRGNALKILSRELRRVYGKCVVVLIDDYDSPVQSAIEHGYAPQVRPFILLCCNYVMCYSRPRISSLEFSVRC